MSTSELDACLLVYLALFDEYQSQRSRLSSHLSRGFFKLAQARFATGRTFGSDQYDSRMKPTCRLHSIDGQWTAATEKTPVATAATTTLRHRGQAGRSHERGSDEKVEAKEGHERTERDPLRWFGVLVPSQLRESQAGFSAALEDIITLDNIVRRINMAEQKVRSLRALHGEAEEMKTN